MVNLECPECHELRADRVDELCAVCLGLVQRRAAYWIKFHAQDHFIVVDDAVYLSDEDWDNAVERLNLAGEGEIP